MYYMIKLYYIVINIIALIEFGTDKIKAKNKKRRIPEKVLIFVSVLGGAVGSYIGMLFFHHKTRKALFKNFIPILAVIQFLFFLYLEGII